MQQLPVIGAGHVLYVFIWALLGMFVSAVAWSNGKTPGYKDYLNGSLGISFEALGVEIADGQPALIVPLTMGLLLALLVRYLPDHPAPPQRARFRRTTGRRIYNAALVLAFFGAQVLVLLLAYRGWWDQLIVYPGE